MANLILNHNQIQLKINRLAIEILERNFEENEVHLVGINTNGGYFAKLLEKALLPHVKPTSQIHLYNLLIDKNLDVTIELKAKSLENKVVVLIDDVANSGKTLFYALKPFMNINLKKLEVAVLIDRKHKTFPVQPDYFGLALATTYQEHIDVTLEQEDFTAYLSN